MLCLQPPAPHVLHCLFNGGENPDEADRRQARVHNTCCDFKRPTLTEKLSITLISLYLLRVYQLYLYLVFIKQIKKSRSLSFSCWSILYAGDLWFGSGLADQIKTKKSITKSRLHQLYLNYISLFKQKAIHHFKRQTFNVQGSDSCWTGGTSESLARWRYLHAQRFSEGKKLLLPLLPVK